MIALLLALAGAQLAPLSLTFDVANPQTLGGHRILHLEDVVGPKRRRDVPDLPAAEAVLLFSVQPDGCGASGGLCAQVAEITEEARQRGALVIGVILASREQAVSAAPAVRQGRHPFPVTFDTHGLARRTLALDGPGVFVVIDSEGVNKARRRASLGGEPAQIARDLAAVRTTLLAALGDREDTSP